MTDNSDIVSAKVIIDKELFERMRRIIEYHKEHCKNSDYGDAVTKGGGGPVGPYGDQASVIKKSDCEVSSPTTIIETSADQRANFNPEGKCTKVSGPTQVNINQTPSENNTKQSNEQILSAIRKKYYTKAKRLLEELDKFPLSVNWNNEGKVVLNGEKYDDTISDLVCLCFYPVKSKTINSTSIWYRILKELHLLSHVTNWEFRKVHLKTTSTEIMIILWPEIIDTLIWVLVLFFVGIIGALKNYKNVPEIIDPPKLSQSPQAPLKQPIHAQEGFLPQIPDNSVEIPQIEHCTIASKTRSGKSYKKLKDEEVKICQLPLLSLRPRRSLSSSSDSSVSLSLSCSSYCPSSTPSSSSISSASPSSNFSTPAGSSRSSSSERSF